MSVLNIVATGNLGRDAERRTTQKGTAVLSFPLASERYDGRERVTEWLDCAIFGKRADALEAHLKKGAKVTVIGTPTARAFTDRQGNARATISVMVDDIALQGAPSGASRQAQGERPQTTDGPDVDDDVPF